MKHIKISLVVLFIVAGLNPIKAQAWEKFTGMVRATKWTAGLGWNIVSDDGNPWHKQFDAKNSWNIPSFPTKLSLDGYYDKGLSFGFCFTYNDYRQGKIINGDVHTSTNFMAFDANAKYNFCELYDFNKLFGFGDNKVFDFYGTGGLGYTYRHTKTVKGVATLNLGFGMNAWVYENWGIQLEALSKFGLTSPFFKTPSNYLQYSIGVVYQFSLANKGNAGTNKPIYHLKPKI